MKYSQKEKYNEASIPNIYPLGGMRRKREIISSDIKTL